MLDGICQPGNYRNDEDIAPYGTKLVGGYLFAPRKGERNTRENAVRSPGHNSVCFDEALNRWFMLHDTRFASMGDRYIVRAREMFFSEDGWPMVAPTRYVPGAEEASEPVLEGSFKLARHERDIDLIERRSVLATLGQDGVIAGEASGSFEVGENGSVEVTLDGVRYAGVYYTGYDDVRDEYVTCLTAMSEEGEALWGMRATVRE